MATESDLNRSKLIWPVAGICLVLVLVFLTWRFMNSPSKVTPSTQTSDVAEKPVEDVIQPAPVETSQAEIEEDLGDIMEDAANEFKPVRWHKPKIKGTPLHLSPEELAISKRLLARYYDNFGKISSIKFHESNKLEALVEDEISRSMMESYGRGLFNAELDLDIRRDPLFFSMTGILGDGSRLEEIITPAGKKTSGRLGSGASWIPRYLDGDFHNIDSVMLLYANSVRENVKFSDCPPGLEEYASDKADVLYDVVEQIHDDTQCIKRYWFNRDTGMLDFLISKKINVTEGESPYHHVYATRYVNVDGVYYPQKVTGYLQYYRTKYTREYTGLSIDGAKTEP